MATSPTSGPGAGGSGSGVTVDSYVTFTSPVSITATTAGTATTIVTAAPITADGATLYCIEFFCYDVSVSGTTPFAIFGLYEGATEIGRIASVSQPGTTQIDFSVFGRRYITPSAAAHTYSVKAYKAGTATANAGDGASGTDNAAPGYIRITHGG